MPLLLLKLYVFRVLTALLDVRRLLLPGLEQRRDRADRALDNRLCALPETVRGLPLVDILLYIQPRDLVCARPLQHVECGLVCRRFRAPASRIQQSPAVVQPVAAQDVAHLVLERLHRGVAVAGVLLRPFLRRAIK